MGKLQSKQDGYFVLTCKVGAVDVTKTFMRADTPIEWIRIDCYGCLNYIYFFWNDKLSDKRIMFDVFCDDDFVDYLVQDISPDDLTKENYNKWVNDYMEKRGWL